MNYFQYTEHSLVPRCGCYTKILLYFHSSNSQVWFIYKIIIQHVHQDYKIADSECNVRTQ